MLVSRFEWCTFLLSLCSTAAGQRFVRVLDIDPRELTHFLRLLDLVLKDVLPDIFFLFLSCSPFPKRSIAGYFGLLSVMVKGKNVESLSIFALLVLFLVHINIAQEVVGSSDPGCTDPPGTSPSEFDAAGAGNLLSDLLAATGVPANWFVGTFIFDNFAFASGSASGCTDLTGNSGGCALPVGPDGTTCEIVNQTLFDSVSNTSVLETPETGKQVYI